MLNIGPQELILILIVALVVVGPQRLPELGRTIGRALREFRKIQDDVKDTIKFDLNDEPEPYVRPKKTSTPGTSSAGGKGAVVEDGVASQPAEALPDANGSLERSAAEDPRRRCIVGCGERPRTASARTASARTASDGVAGSARPHERLREAPPPSARGARGEHDARRASGRTASSLDRLHRRDRRWGGRRVVPLRPGAGPDPEARTATTGRRSPSSNGSTRRARCSSRNRSARWS